MKFSRRDAAERYTIDSVLLCQLQTGAIAGGKQYLVFLCKPSADDRADGVENIIARQIVGGREFGLPGRFLMPLFLHKLRTGKPKLNARISVSGVINTAVARAETAQHLAICGVHNSAAFQSGGKRSVPSKNPLQWVAAGGHSSGSAATASDPVRFGEFLYPCISAVLSAVLQLNKFFFRLVSWLILSE